MSAALQTVPAPQRRRALFVSAGFALLLLVIGLAPWVGSASVPVRAMATLALAGAILLGLVSWGLAQSLRQDAQLAAAVGVDVAAAHTVAQAGALASYSCDCGHEHDADELHIADEPAAGQAPAQHLTGERPTGEQPAGGGQCASGPSSACEHTCATCTLRGGKSAASEVRA